jgi:hypothetical protein
MEITIGPFIEGVNNYISDIDEQAWGKWHELGRKVKGVKQCDLAKADYCAKSGFDVDSPEFTEFFGHMQT